MKHLLAAALTFVCAIAPMGSPHIALAEPAKANEPILYAPPFVAMPTADSVIINLVNGEQALKGDLRYRIEGSNTWLSSPLNFPPIDMDHLQTGVHSVKLTGLKSDTRYEYAVRMDDKDIPNASGFFMTQRTKPGPFTFIAMTDAHVNPLNPERSPELRFSGDIAAEYKPDFVLHLGDNIQMVETTHGGPAAQEDHPNILYLYFRQVLGKLQSQGGQFVLNGNWEGENGWHPEPNRSWARDARMAFAPAPDNTTFPEGGNKNQDYYAFTWGNALFVSLNATGYNSINHEHTKGPGTANDWTLGKAQLVWLEKTLSRSQAPWKFIFIHHAVGGNAGDEVNSRYGRGGGRVAHIGEQAQVHEMMKKYGVQVFFYGHDHVFTDMKVDGIHYICTGSVGAPWKFTTAETGYKDYIPDSGFTVVDLQGESARVRYVSYDQDTSAGKVLYSLDLKLKGN